MKKQRIAMLLITIVATTCLLIMSRPDSKPAVLAAHVFSEEPQNWLAVSGDVRYPGLYPLPADGLTGSSVVESEPDCLLPASIPLLNSPFGLRLQITCTSDTGIAEITQLPLTTEEQLLLGIPLDINSISAAQLQQIQGIGPVMATRIIKARDDAGGFKNLSQLLEVKGIGSKRLQQLSEYLQVAGEEESE